MTFLKLLNKDGFTPQTLGGLQLWLDASDASTITESGGFVSQWDNKTIKNNNVTQGIGSAQPATGANTLNGKNVITATTNDYLICPSALYSIASGANTIFTVSKITSETGSLQRLINGTDGGASRYYIQYSSAAGTINFISGNTSPVGSTGNTNTGFNIIRGSRDGTTQTLAINGGSESTNADGSDQTGIDAMTIFAQPTPGNYMTGEIAEILIYNKLLSAMETKRIEDYLSNKWRIALS